MPRLSASLEAEESDELESSVGVVASRSAGEWFAGCCVSMSVEVEAITSASGKDKETKQR